MRLLTNTCLRTAQGAVWCGVRLGFVLAMGYSLLFALYAILRSSLQIGASLPPAEGLLGTLVANAFALLLASLVSGLLLGAFAAVIAGVILLLVYGFNGHFNRRRSPVLATWIGLLTAGIPAVALVLFAQQTLGIYFDSLWPVGFLFWLGVPLLLFVGTTAWISGQGVARQREDGAPFPPGLLDATMAEARRGI